MSKSWFLLLMGLLLVVAYRRSSKAEITVSPSPSASVLPPPRPPSAVIAPPRAPAPRFSVGDTVRYLNPAVAGINPAWVNVQGRVIQLYWQDQLNQYVYTFDVQTAAGTQTFTDAERFLFSPQ